MVEKPKFGADFEENLEKILIDLQLKEQVGKVKETLRYAVADIKRLIFDELYGTEY